MDAAISLTIKGNTVIGEKADITKSAVKAVFEYMYLKSEETGYYEISIDGVGTMKFERTDSAPFPTESEVTND